MRPTEADRRDVTILGGGLAGLCLALQCRQLAPQARITVLEKNKHPVPEAAFKVGESTVEVAADYFTRTLGLERHILQEQLPKLGLRFFFGAGDNAAVERRLEVGGRRFAPAPSYQLDRGRFENYLARRCLSQDIDFLDGATVKEVKMGRGRQPHQVRYELKCRSGQLRSRWIADASGRAALLKRQLGLQKPSPHRANAAWFRVQESIRIDDWSSDPRWHEGYGGQTARWYSTNHLMGEGYWVWLIPLASGSTSIGIVADEQLHPPSRFNSLDKALQWLKRHEPQCAEKIGEHRDRVLDFRAMKRYAMECTQVFSRRRWGITGEAGFFLDPFYSPGSDFIAFANTFLSDLIRRDLSGRPYWFRAFLYDRIFKSFFYGTAATYQDQYQLFGNHQVMPVKIMWDYLVYWSLTAHVFMNDRLCDSLMYPRHMFKLRRLSELNHWMQEVFRRWHRECSGREVSGSVDISGIDLIRETNERLRDQLSNREYDRRFAQNVAQMETLFWEIVEAAGLDFQPPLKRRRHVSVRQDALQLVFEATTPAGVTSPQPFAEL